jgi:hypothetical protein
MRFCPDEAALTVKSRVDSYFPALYFHERRLDEDPSSFHRFSARRSACDDLISPIVDYSRSWRRASASGEDSNRFRS